jgi:DNA-binding NtrC family response regulator
MARILVVDDSVSVREAVRDMLEGAGHTVTMAPSVAAATHLLCLEPFELVVTDIYMPDEDGLKLITHTRRQYPNTPVIAMSSKSGEWDMLGPARRLGAVHILRKPFAAPQLLGLVEEALEVRTPSR